MFTTIQSTPTTASSSHEVDGVNVISQSSNNNNNNNNTTENLSNLLTRSLEKEEYLRKRKGLSIRVFEMSWDCYRRCISHLISEFFQLDRKSKNQQQQTQKSLEQPQVIVCIMTGANVISESIQV